MSRNAPDPLALIRHAQDELRMIRDRWVMLDAFVRELDRVTRREPFTIMNELVWTAMLDARDMLVVHFSQWIRSATSAGGVLTGLKHCPASSFYVPRKPKELPDSSRIVGPRLTEEQRRAFARERRDAGHASRLAVFAKLFPGAASVPRAPNRADWDALTTRFDERLGPVVQDRNHNRAHPRYGHGKWTSSAEMHDLEQLLAHLEWATTFLNDLRLLLDDSQLVYAPPHQETSAAEGLVDLLLFGSRDHMDALSGLSAAAHVGAGKYAWQYREPLYEAMWSQRATLDQPFNDPEQLRDRDEGYVVFEGRSSQDE
ncbi:MAG: hypothetical protein R3B99_37300 [Polyangiales bacterium]